MTAQEWLQREGWHPSYQQNTLMLEAMEDYANEKLKQFIRRALAIGLAEAVLEEIDKP